MQMRALSFSFSLALAFAFMGLPSSGAETDIPRTPSGKPDLSGTYDIGSLTPLQRDEKYGESVYTTAAETRKLEEAAIAAQAEDDASRATNRVAPPSIKDEDFKSIGAYNRFWFDRGTTTFAVDGKYRTSILTDPADGRLPPVSELGTELRAGAPLFSYKNTGLAWWMETAEAPYDGPETQTLGTRCLFAGGPTVPMKPSAYNNVKTITQTDTHVSILVEWMHWNRIVRLNSEHLPPEIRSFGGDSIGWWEGDTLVVETTNFRLPPPAPWAQELLAAQDSASQEMRVVERFTPIDGDTLHYEFTVDDPGYTAPYTGSLPFPRTDAKLFEYACHEGNYSMGNMMRGARQLEEEWRAERTSSQQP